MNLNLRVRHHHMQKFFFLNENLKIKQKTERMREQVFKQNNKGNKVENNNVARKRYSNRHLKKVNEIKTDILT